MKKLTTLAAMVLAVASVNAASIQWSLSTGAATMKSPGATTALTGTAYLILANDLADLQSDIATDGFAETIKDYKLGDAPISSGKITTTQTATSDKLTAGNGYDFQVVIYDSSSNQYYTSSVKNQKAYDPTSTDDALQIPKAITLGADDVYATRGANASTAPWASGEPSGVPEPATGALALAGVALLFKRRRA